MSDVSSEEARSMAANWEFGQRYPAPAGCATAYIVTSEEALAARAEAEKKHRQLRPMESDQNEQVRSA